jgi:hypothetical protein
MMNFLSRWHKSPSYESLLWLESEVMPGVEFSIRKISLSQRLDLTARIRQLTVQHEFLRAGNLSDQLEANMAELIVQKLYVEWAVAAVRGLRIDGEAASLGLVLERGPEELVAEMATAIRSHLGLTDEDRKNS